MMLQGPNLFSIQGMWNFLSCLMRLFFVLLFSVFTCLLVCFFLSFSFFQFFSLLGFLYITLMSLLPFILLFFSVYLPIIYTDASSRGWNCTSVSECMGQYWSVCKNIISININNRWNIFGSCLVRGCHGLLPALKTNVTMTPSLVFSILSV